MSSDQNQSIVAQGALLADQQPQDGKDRLHLQQAEELKKNTLNAPQQAGTLSLQPGPSTQPVEAMALKQPVQQTVFHDIIDVYSELSKGNIGPLLICLEHHQIEVNEKDHNQQTLLHYCVLYNLLDLAIFLIRTYQANPNQVNGQNQTPLAWACNYGRIEFVKLLVDNSVNLNEIIDLPDKYNFTNTLYAIKGQINQIFFEMLYLGGSPFSRDGNKSSIAHWAAYYDNVFVLRFCKKIGVSLHELDGQGYTPLRRALNNYSYKAFKYLAYENPVAIPKIEHQSQTSSSNFSQAIQFEQNVLNQSKSIQKITKEANFYNYTLLPLYATYKRHLKVYLNLAYAMVAFILVSGYYSQKGSNSYSQFNITLWCQILFACLYMNFWLWKVPSPVETKTRHLFSLKKSREYEKLDTQHTKKQLPPYMKDIVLSEFAYMDFSYLNKLLKLNDANKSELIDVELAEQDRNLFDSEINKSFLHEIAILYEAERFIELQSLDFKRMCPTCLKYKPPSTSHCRICDKCVPDYSHHSFTFGMCINSSNHIYYFFKQIIEQIILVEYIVAFFMFNNKFRTSYAILIGFETPYLMAGREEYWALGAYVLAWIMLFYNSLYLLIEVVGLLKGFTRNELYHNERYKYLYTPIYHGFSNSAGFYNVREFKPFSDNIRKYMKKVIANTRIRR